MKRHLINATIVSISALIAASGIAAQNYKIKQTTSMMGQDMTSTVYVKGSRKRTESSGMMGMGGDVAMIEQCDLKQTLQVSDKKKMYFIEPFATEQAETAPAVRPTAATAAEKITMGGTITMTSVINDTGERKQMFGLTARHIKTSMTMQSSPDACSKNDMSIETDGWYVDLPLFVCPVTVPRNPMAGMDAPKRGCMDKTIVKSSGGGKLGFALELTQTMKSDGTESFTQSISTVEFTKATLDGALFDVPAGYAKANSSQDLYGRPDFAAMMGGNRSDDDEKPTQKPAPKMTSSTPAQTGAPAARKAGVVRIGVLPPTNRGGDSISVTNMQAFLAQKLTSRNVEGVAVSTDADAKSAGCDYVLSSDFSKLKLSTAAKIGGMFGKITNTAVGANYDAQVDYKLVSLASGQVAAGGKAASKTESDVDRAAEGVLSQEAVAVLGAVK